jgi:hypothetical protein
MKILALLLFVSLPAFADVTVSGGWASIRNLDAEGSDAAAGAITVNYQNIDFTAGYTGRQGETAPYYWGAVEGVLALPLKAVTLRAGGGLGVRTWAEHIEQALHSTVNFSLVAGVDVGRLQFTLRHMSNANISKPNDGQNWLMAGWRF